MNPTYIEMHYDLSVSAYEGYWEMTFKNPFAREEHVSILIEASNSNPDNTPKKDRLVVKPGPRLNEVLDKLLLKIEAYPYTWDFSGKKIVSYGYDFETDYSGTSITKIDLTEIAFREVNEHFNFFSPLAEGIVAEGEQVRGKGVLAKLKITLNLPRRINNLELDFFAEYPMELMTLMYQEDESLGQNLYEIPLTKAVSANNSMYIHFAPVFAKTFYLIIRQESYTLSSSAKTTAETAKDELWNQASERSKAIYESSVGDYMDQLFASADAIQLHQEVLDSYKNVSKPLDAPSQSSLNKYRDEFNQAKKELDSAQR